jgi:DNA mismatch repair ATPase MutS
LVEVLLIEGAIIARIRKPLDEILSGAEGAFENLRLLAALPERIEREPFKTTQLQELVKTLSSHDLPASRTIGKLATIVQWIESRRNPLLAVLQIPLMYPVHAALAAQRWRSAHGHVVAPWLDAIGTIEALNSLAGYSYEHPADPFPAVVDGPAAFVGESMGHPLIPEATCVRNGLSIDGATRVILISGSNMSGKSTLLRTVGINTVLAMAGAPVRATSLRLTALQVGASIRINDSLHEGSSRFYAEITRLRQLHDISEQSDDKTPHLLFLLDELLQGTNSTDRRIGAEGVIRAFMDEGSIGLISTHDLALTDVDGDGSRRLRNHHFQDELIEGRLRFDFTLRDGVVTRSNGVELMRSIGLKV